eukprot:363350-Chlamydomonas_euryale.AAC.4
MLLPQPAQVCLFTRACQSCTPLDWTSQQAHMRGIHTNWPDKRVSAAALTHTRRTPTRRSRTR